MDTDDYQLQSRNDKFLSKKKLNKRDIAVKLVKKQRELEYYEKLARQEDQAYEDSEPQEVHPGAGKIILVQNSYLMKENKNHLKNDNLPRKWSSKFQEDSDELEDDEDEDEEQDSTTSGIEVDNDSDIDDGDDEESVDLYDEHDNDDDDDFTRRSVVQFIDDMNEVEIIPLAVPPAAAGRRRSHSGQKSPSFKERARRVASKSPKLAAKTPPFPPINGVDDDDDDLDSDEHGSSRHKNKRQQGNNINNDNTQQHPGGRGTPGFYAQRKQNAQSKKLADQMQALDLDGGAFASSTGSHHHHHSSHHGHQHSDTHATGNAEREVVNKPGDDCLDASEWWRYLLSTASVQRDKKIYITVIDKFPFAQKQGLTEDYFHFPSTRRSQPEQACTAFGLYSAKVLADNGGAKAKKQKKFSLFNLKRSFTSLADEDKQKYLELALCEKIRYKLQRCEFVHNYNSGKS